MPRKPTRQRKGARCHLLLPPLARKQLVCGFGRAAAPRFRPISGACAWTVSCDCYCRTANQRSLIVKKTLFKYATSFHEMENFPWCASPRAFQRYQIWQASPMLIKMTNVLKCGQLCCCAPYMYSRLSRLEAHARIYALHWLRREGRICHATTAHHLTLKSGQKHFEKKTALRRSRSPRSVVDE